MQHTGKIVFLVFWWGLWLFFGYSVLFENPLHALHVYQLANNWSNFGVLIIITVIMLIWCLFLIFLTAKVVIKKVHDQNTTNKEQ